MNHLNEDNLLRYAFDLLDEQQRTAAQTHLEDCADCRAKLKGIQRQFAVLDALDEEETLSEELIQKTLLRKAATQKIPFYRTLWFEWAAIAASVALIMAVLLQNLPQTRIPRPAPSGLESQQIARQDQPTESGPRRLTAGHSGRGAESPIPATETLSVQGDKNILNGIQHEVKVVSADAIPDKPPFAPASAIELVVLPKPDTMQLTIYNAEDLTLIRDTRRLTLKPGWNWLQFMWDGTLIDPTSLSLTPLEYADKIDIQQLVYPARLQHIGRWLIRSEVEGSVPFEITYFAAGLSWRAFYMGTMNADETAMSLKGYVNVSNNSGQDFENAQTRLVVGETRLIEKIPDLARRRNPYGPDIVDDGLKLGDTDGDDRWWDRRTDSSHSADFGGYGGGGYAFKYEIKQIEKEGLSEYFLYTIEGTEDLPNTWAKRLPSFDIDGIPVTSLYKYDEDRYGGQTVRFVSFANDAEHELGQTPIPEGSIKIYRDLNAAQNLSYIGQSGIKYIPVNEDVELNLGSARLVKVEPVLMQTQTDNYTFDEKHNITGWDTLETWQIKLSNTRDIPVDLEITRNFATDYWDIEVNAPENVEYKKHDKSHARFELTLPARTEQHFTYTVTKYEGARSEDYIKWAQKQQKPAVTVLKNQNTPKLENKTTFNNSSEEEEELPCNMTDYLNLPPSPETERRLAQMADFSFLQGDTTFEDALTKISQLTDPPLSLVVMWDELSEYGFIEKETPIDFTANQTMTVSSGLESLLDAISKDAFAELHYFIEEDVIVVATEINQMRFYFYHDQTAQEAMPAPLRQQISLQNLRMDSTFKDVVEKIASVANPPLSINVLWDNLSKNAFIEPDAHIRVSISHLPPISVDFALRLILYVYGTRSFDKLIYAYSDESIIIATCDTISDITGDGEPDEFLQEQGR